MKYIDSFNMLIIEDQIVLRDINRDLFSVSFPNAKIMTLENILELEKVLRENSFNFILVDGNLAEYDPFLPGIKPYGEELVPIIRAIQPKTCIIAFSSNSTSNDLFRLKKVKYSIEKGTSGVIERFKNILDEVMPSLE